MAENTKIAWTTHTWNPWRGCKKISPGCDNCYMFTAQKRGGLNPAIVTRCGTANWKQPKRWQEEAALSAERIRAFTCSWSDFFHKDADPWRAEAWQVIRETPRVQYQILTKRPGRITQSLPPDWGAGYPNVWLGVSIETPDYLWRMETLKQIPARVHFISFEPLLTSVAPLDLTGIEWVIVGGESGPGFRPMDYQWAREIRDAARESGTAFFFKQSSHRFPERGIELDGRIVREYPIETY